MAIRILSALLGVAALSGCAANLPRDDWTAKDTRRELYYAAALATDAHLTTQGLNLPGVYEANPFVNTFIGKHPSSAEIWRASVAVGLAHYFITRRLPAKWRPVWQLVPTAIHTDLALSNYDLNHSIEAN